MRGILSTHRSVKARRAAARAALREAERARSAPVKVEWLESDVEGAADLWVNGRIAEYAVAPENRADALRRARVR